MCCVCCFNASASIYRPRVARLPSRLPPQVQRPNLWSQISLDLSILAQLLRLLRWAGRIQQDITRWADTLGTGLACELDYVQVRVWGRVGGRAGE